MLKKYAAGKYPGSGSSKKKKRALGRVPPFQISLTHEICSFGLAESLSSNLKCAFKSPFDVKQLIALR